MQETKSAIVERGNPTKQTHIAMWSVLVMCMQSWDGTVTRGGGQGLLSSAADDPWDAAFCRDCTKRDSLIQWRSEPIKITQITGATPTHWCQWLLPKQGWNYTRVCEFSKLSHFLPLNRRNQQTAQNCFLYEFFKPFSDIPAYFFRLLSVHQHQRENEWINRVKDVAHMWKANGEQEKMQAAHG